MAPSQESSELSTRRALLSVLPLHPSRAYPAWMTTYLMRRAGVEPARPFGHCLLKTACLPFHHLRVSAEGGIRTPMLVGAPVLQTGAANRIRPPQLRTQDSTFPGA